MKIMETNIKGSYPEYLGCLLFGIIMSIVMTILSIQAYYTRDITFGFVVVFGVLAYLWTIICIVMGIREMIVVRNNKILKEIEIRTNYLSNHFNSFVDLVYDEINLMYEELRKIRKDNDKCKKKSC